MFHLGSISDILARFIVIFTAISVHEFSHGFAAYKLGDPTAKYGGRLTLNPLSHLDPYGALCMLLFGFGWAKPVPINPMYFRDRKRDTAITALAGPIANIILAFLFSVIAAVYMVYICIPFRNIITLFIQKIFIQLAVVNIGFAIFNLIPFPPLDGSKILGAFLSNESYMKLLQYERFGFPVIIILSLTGILDRILSILTTPIYNSWINSMNMLISILE